MLHTLDVPPTANDTRLDVWLESVLEGCTRSLVARLIRDGLCTVEGPANPKGERRETKAKPGLFLRGGERVSLDVPEIEPMSEPPSGPNWVRSRNVPNRRRRGFSYVRGMR